MITKNQLVHLHRRRLIKWIIRVTVSLPRALRVKDCITCPLFPPDVTVEWAKKDDISHLSWIPVPSPPISPLGSFRFPPSLLRIPLPWHGSHSSPIFFYSTQIQKVMRSLSFLRCYSLRSHRFESLISDYNSITHLSLNFSRKLAPSHSWTINQTLGLNHFPLLSSLHSFRSRRELLFPSLLSLR